MGRFKELLKNTGILMIARISTQVVSFLLLPLYTSLLSTETYGEIDIYTSLAMILIPFLTLQIEMGMFRYIITAEKEDEKLKILSTSFVISALSIIVGSVVYWPAAIALGLNYAVYLYFYYVILAIAAVLLQVSRAYGNNKCYAFASFLASALTVALNVVFIAGLGLKTEGILLSSIIANTAACIYIVFRITDIREIRLFFYDKEKRKELLGYSVPLIFNQISSWVINYSDRFIILTFWGKGLNGIYAAANKFSNILNTFFGVYNLAWTENVVRSMKDKNNSNYVSKVFSFTLEVYLMVITLIINFLPLVFDLLIKGEFKEAYYQVPILLLSMFFSGMAATLGSIFIAYNRTKNVSITTTLAAAVNIIIHMVMLNRFRLFAASISTLAAFGTLFVYRLFAIRKTVAVKVDLKQIVIPSAVFLFSAYAYYSRNTVIILAGMALELIYCSYALFKQKDTLLTLLKSLGKKKAGNENIRE